jgi:hypothetical protein
MAGYDCHCRQCRERGAYRSIRAADCQRRDPARDQQLADLWPNISSSFARPRPQRGVGATAHDPIANHGRGNHEEGNN